jgi:hypothetical protein
MTETVQEPQKTDQVPQVAAPLVPVPQEHSGLTKSLGNWAYDHKPFFQSTTGSLAFRNAARTLTAIFPYLLVNVGAQHFFHHTVDKGKNLLGSQTLTKLFKPKIMQQAVGIALSFTTFRSFCKVWQNNYDRIFGAKTADEAADAIGNLPVNAMRDATHIVLSELAATGLSAITLAAIRTGLKTPEPPGILHPVGKNYVNDYLANALGYTVFFEASDRLYSVFNKNHFNGQYKGGTLPEDVNQQREKASHAKYDTFTEDSPLRVVFRNGASVFVAALPYIALQRLANSKTGNYQPGKNSYWKDVLHVGTKSWEIPFAVFTVGIEGFQRAYDKLFKKLEEKHANEKNQQSIG